MNEVDRSDVTASRQNKDVRGVQEGIYTIKGKITVSGRIENIRLY